MSIARSLSESHIELTGQNAPDAIGTILKEIETHWRAHIKSPNVTLTCFITPELHDVPIEDAAPLQNGMAALLGNAHQLTSSGRIHIHATMQPSLDEAHRPAITIIIADTGAGIAPASLEALFLQGRPLAPLQSWAKENDGGLAVISNLGRGSEFTLTFRPPALTQKAPIEEGPPEEQVSHYLPIDLGLDNDIAPYEIITQGSQPVMPRSVPTSQPSKSPLSGSRVLIVEDVISNQNVIMQLLKSEDCHCICANSGPRALNILETQSVDFILMDILMPGMSGIETTHAIRQSGKDYAHTPIIALTADLNPENNAACMAAGANIFLTKPVLAKNLIEALKFLKRTQVDTAYKMPGQRIIAA